MDSQRAVFVLVFGAGVGTGHFILKLLGADAWTHPGTSERELIPFCRIMNLLDFSDGAITALNAFSEKYTLKPVLCGTILG